MSDDLSFDLEVNTGSSAAQVKALATALSGLGDSLRDVGRTINNISNQADKIERGLAGIGKAARGAKQDLASLNNTKLDPSFKATREKLKFGADPDFAATRAALGIDLEAQAAAKATAEQNRKLREQIALRKQIVEEARKARMGDSYVPSKIGTRGQAMLPANPAGSAVYLATAQAAKEAERATLAFQAANLASAKAAMDHMNRLTNLRYTLYDVQRTFIVAGLGLAAFNVITIKAAMDYETAMAQISRTSGIAGNSLEQVREEFMSLAQSIPTTFADLSKIGTLGGQLNIPAENLADFSKTVAQFTTTTNVAVEQAATAFGRLDALLPDVQGNYEALGSSILNVGINSVATETEIINATNQIAAAGQQAGFAASEIIGLAASYASLGVAPEAARGTTIRFFSEIRTALSEGGADLEKFAQLSGKSIDQFRSDWNADAGDAFLDLLNGMKQVAAEGGNVESVLRSMGITAVRDINALLKLSQNAEIVANNFAYAAEGFDEGTQLAAAFEVQAATLASKIQVLTNTVQAFFAEMGAGGIPVLGAIVDGLSGFVKWLTDLAKIPAVQYAAALVGGFTALTAVLAVAGFAFARVTSATIAFRTAIATMRYEALAANGGLATLRATVTGLTSAMYGGAVGAKVLKGALISTGIGAAFVAAGFAIEGIIAELDKLRPAADRAKEAFGDLSGLSDALEADTAAVKEGAKSYGEVTGEIFRTTEATSAWAVELNNATGVQTNLDGAVTSTTRSMGEQVYQIGENTAAWIANRLATDESLKSFLIWAQQVASKQGLTFNTEGFITALTRNDIAGANAIIAQFEADLNAKLNSGFDIGAGFELRDAGEQIAALKEVVTLYGGAVEGAATSTEIYNTVMDASGASAERMAQALGEISEEAAQTVSSLQVIQDAVDAAFANQNLVSQMSQDFYNLASSVFEGGAAFDTFSQQGITNLANFQQSIGTVIAAGETMGISATQSVAALFVQLQAMGIDTANLLASIANIPGISISAVQQQMGKLSPQAQYLSNALGAVAGQAKAAGRNLGGGGGGGGGGTAGGARKAAQEIRTLVDYANDLRSVFSRAFDIRFSAGDAMDTISSGWMDIADATKEALQNIQEIQAELTSLSADKSINQYFLGVAEAYGDTLRAADIRGELAKIDAEMAENQAKLGEEQDKTNKSLVGNTSAAIDNRKTITGLVKNYQELIEAYAASGMDQTQLAAKTAELKQQFMAQATQLGFSSLELSKYSDAFDDVALAINRVPRNITVVPNLNPALQALAEFEAKAAKAGANAAGSIASGGGRGYSIAPINMPDPYPNGYEMARRWKAQWNTATQTFQMRDVNTGAWVKTGLQMYKTGGYTGNVNPSDVAGLVHGKEFVVNAENTAKFRPILEAMNKGRMPIMASATAGAGGIQVVELSARDRALLAAAGNVTLTIDGRVVADATNSANFVSTKRGSS